MTTGIKLLLVELQSAEPTSFGNKGVMYFPYESVTENNERLVVFISENSFRKAGLNPAFDCDSLIGSHLLVQDSISREGELEQTAEERLEDVLSGERNFLLTNAANAKIIKSESLKESLKREKTDILGRVVVEREREREFQKKQDAAKRMIERMTKLGSTGPVATETEEELDPEDDGLDNEPPVQEPAAPVVNAAPANGTRRRAAAKVEL